MEDTNADNNLIIRCRDGDKRFAATGALCHDHRTRAARRHPGCYIDGRNDYKQKA